MINLRIPYLFTALALILSGALIQSPAWVEMLRSEATTSPVLTQRLLLGTTILRVCLVVLGVILTVLPRLPIWKQNGNRLDVDRISYPRRHWALLFVILIVAFLLRVYDLNAGIWHDEVSMYVTYVKTMPLGDIATSYISENQHFLFTLLARLSVVIFGDSYWALRLPAVLFGVASIWALYLFGREVATVREALVSATLMTVSYHHIWFSQNARGYTGLLLFATLSSYFFMRILRGGALSNWVWYAITVALGVYTHTTMLFAVMGQFGIFLWWVARQGKLGWRDGWIGLTLGFCFAGFLTIFLYAPALPQFLTTINETSTVAAWKNPLWTFLEIVRGIQLGFGSSVVVVPALLVFGIGVWSYLRTRPEVVWLLVIPSALCIATMMTLGHHLWPRFFFFLMGFAVLIAVRGAVCLGEWVARWLPFRWLTPNWVGTAFAGGMVLVSLLTVPFVYGPKQNYEDALTYIEEHRGTRDVVTTIGLAGYTYRNLYQMDWPEVESLHDLDLAQTQGEHTWIIYTFPPEIEAVYPDILQRIEQDFTVVMRFPGTVNNGTIYVAVANKKTT